MIEMLNIKAVSARLNIGKTKLKQLIKKGDFPQPARLGERSQRWSSLIVERWIENQHSQSFNNVVKLNIMNSAECCYFVKINDKYLSLGGSTTLQKYQIGVLCELPECAVELVKVDNAFKIEGFKAVLLGGLVKSGLVRLK